MYKAHAFGFRFRSLLSSCWTCAWIRMFKQITNYQDEDLYCASWINTFRLIHCVWWKETGKRRHRKRRKKNEMQYLLTTNYIAGRSLMMQQQQQPHQTIFVLSSFVSVGLFDCLKYTILIRNLCVNSVYPVSWLVEYINQNQLFSPARSCICTSFRVASALGFHEKANHTHSQTHTHIRIKKIGFEVIFCVQNGFISMV